MDSEIGNMRQAYIDLAYYAEEGAFLAIFDREMCRNKTNGYSDS